MANELSGLSAADIERNAKAIGIDVPKGFSQSRAERYARATGAELLSIPAAASGLIGLAQAGYQFLADLPDTGFSTDALIRSTLTDSGRNKYDIMNDPKSPEIMKAAAGMTFNPEQDLNWGLRNAHEWWEWASDKAGLDRKAGEFPLDEDIFAIVATAVLPWKLVTKPLGMIQRYAGRTAAMQAAARIAQTASTSVSSLPNGLKLFGRGVEIVTPLSIPYTRANMLINAAGGVAFNDIMRAATGETSLIGAVAGQPPQETQERRDAAVAYGKEVVNANGEDPRKTVTEASHWYLYALGAAGFVGAALLGRGLYRKLHQAQPPRAPSMMEHGGGALNPNLSQFDSSGRQLAQIFPEDAPENTLAGVTGLTPSGLYPATKPTSRKLGQTLWQDSSAAIREVARRTGGEAMSEALDAEVAARTRAGLENLISNVIDSGHLPTDVQIHPLARLARQSRWFNQPRYNAAITSNVDLQRLGIKDGDTLLREALSAGTERQDRRIAHQVAQQRIAEITSQLSTAPAKERPALRKELARWHALYGPNKEIRMGSQAYSTADLDVIIRAAESNPEMKRLLERVGEYTSALREYRRTRGVIDNATSHEWAQKYGRWYIPKQEDEIGAEMRKAGLFGRTWIRAREGFRKAVHQQGVVSELRGANVDAARHFDLDTIESRVVTNNAPVAGTQAVNNPLDPFDALARYTGRVIRDAEQNAIRRRVIDIIRNNPEMDSAVRLVSTYTRAQDAAGLVPVRTKSGQPYLRIWRAGRLELWDMGDSLLRQSLDFAPFAVEGIMQLSRRVAQATLTGALAPWFSLRGLAWDNQIGFITRHKGRSMGIIDAVVSAYTSGKYDTRHFLIGDPTIWITAPMGSVYHFFENMRKHTGEWLANEVANSPTLLGRLAHRHPGVRTWLQNFGEQMVRRYEQTPAGILAHKGNYGPGAQYLYNQADRVIGTNWRASHNPLARMYGQLLDSIHNGAKMSFFAQNLAMHRIIKGRPMTKVELGRLINETRQLSGDMSKSGLSRNYNKVVGTLPYANVYVQSMAHIARTIKKRPFTFAGGMVSSIFIPAYASRTLIDMAGEETRDWYYNKFADWQRASTISFPIANGMGPMEAIVRGTYKHDPKDWLHVSVAPELVLFLQGAWATLEAFGIGPQSSAARESSALKDLQQAGHAALPMLVPPLAAAALEATGMRFDPAAIVTDEDMLRPKPENLTMADPGQFRMDLDIGKNAADSMIALFGGTMQIALELAAASNSFQEDDTIDGDEAFERVFKQGIEHMARKTEFVRDIWGYQQQYGGTPITEEWYRTTRKLSTVMNQFNIEMFGARNNADMRMRLLDHDRWPDRINKPVGDMSPEFVRAMVAKTKAWFASTTIRETTAQMTALLEEKELTQNNYRLGVQERIDKLNELESKRQELARGLYDHFIVPWEKYMRVEVGDPDFTASDFVDIVNEATGPAGRSR